MTDCEVCTKVSFFITKKYSDLENEDEVEEFVSNENLDELLDQGVVEDLQTEIYIITKIDECGDEIFEEEKDDD